MEAYGDTLRFRFPLVLFVSTSFIHATASQHRAHRGRRLAKEDAVLRNGAKDGVVTADAGAFLCASEAQRHQLSRRRTWRSRRALRCVPS